MKVKCPGCRQVFHETTDAYQPNVRANGSMLKLLEPWAGWGWDTFGDNRKATASVLASEMFCPSCDSPLAPGGRLRVVLEPLGETLKRVSEENQVRIEKEFRMDPFGIEIGRVERVDVFKCHECGWTGKTEPALKRHITMRHKS